MHLQLSDTPTKYFTICGMDYLDGPFCDPGYQDERTSVATASCLPVDVRLIMEMAWDQFEDMPSTQDYLERGISPETMHEAGYFNEEPLGLSPRSASILNLDNVMEAAWDGNPPDTTCGQLDSTSSLFQAGGVQTTPSDNNGDPASLGTLYPEALDTHSKIWNREASNLPQQQSNFSYHSKPMPRRQNHACDQCRASKKACDLAMNASTSQKHAQSPPCTTCMVRGQDCTTVWAVKRQSAQEARRASRAARNLQTGESVVKWTSTDGATPERHFGIPTPTSTIEIELARKLIANDTCTEQFHLYVDAFDVPISQCLLSGSMPPRYSLGVIAFESLSRSPYISDQVKRANSWVETCWSASTQETGLASMAAAPHLFRTVSMLDALFCRPSTLKAGSHTAARDAAITEAYKWVAVATAAQFSLETVQADCSTQPASESTRVRSRDIAIAAWRKAKEKVFGNIAATDSFRLAQSLVLFGFISPPSESKEDQALCEEDSTFAFCEGLRRLQTLCGKARATMEADTQCTASQSACAAKGTVLSHVAADVLELIGAVEWFVAMVNSIIIGTSKGSICPLPVDASQTCAHDPKAKSSLLRPSYDHDLDNAILARARSEAKAVTTVWFQAGDNDHSIIQAGRQSASVAILLWKAVSRFIIAIDPIRTGSDNADYDLILQRYSTAAAIIELWRTTFGAFDTLANVSLQRYRRQAWRMFAFCSNDTDLAILLFHDAVAELEAQVSLSSSSIAEQRLARTLRETNSFRARQRLLSAAQVSIVAASCQSGFTTNLSEVAIHPVSLPPLYRRLMGIPSFCRQWRVTYAKSC